MGTTLQERIKALEGARLNAAEKYYAITLLGTKSGRVEWSCHGLWVGFDDGNHNREIRKARLMAMAEASEFASLWRDIGENYLVLRTLGDLFLFYLAGGNALIEQSLVESRAELRDMVKPRVTVRVGPVGFVAVDGLPAASFDHAPSPRQRMRILKRDDYRCRVCGRRPRDHVDIELHVHHIRPWGNGRITVDENLITLCHTCHKGLEPHEEWNLFSLIAPTKEVAGASGKGHAYREAVRAYRTHAVKMFQEVNKSKRKAGNIRMSRPLRRSAHATGGGSASR